MDGDASFGSQMRSLASIFTRRNVRVESHCLAFRIVREKKPCPRLEAVLGFFGGGQARPKRR